MTKSLVAVIAIVTAVAGWLFFSGKEDASSDALGSSSASGGSKRPASLTERLAQRRQARETEASEGSAALRAVYARWDEAKRDLTGQALLDARQAIAKDAVMQLGGSGALLKFLEFLKKEGQGDLREWVVTEGVKELFASPETGPAAQEWLRGLEDAKMQESLCFAAGQGFKGPGFKEYLDTFTSIHAQSRLLGGYFSEMATTNPEGAIQAYFKARPSKVDFTSLKHVMAAVPAGSDYTKIAGMVPGDSQSLAKSARKALLGTWAVSAPAEAGDYILSNKVQVHPDQLGTVIEVWMANDPEGARNWVEALEEGEHRDIAMASLSRQMIPADPAQAWTVALAIPDTKRREEAMKAVHQEWMKKDPKAADTAWKTMRGQKK